MNGLPMQEMVQIQQKPYDLFSEIKSFKKLSNRMGAFVLFEGVARDFSNNKEIKKLEFEQYEGMAQNQLLKIYNQILEKFSIIHLKIIHRIGPIDISEGIVLILVSAMHRDEAYLASRWCIDQIKLSVPIWKKEWTTDGVEWVSPTP